MYIEYMEAISLERKFSCFYAVALLYWPCAC